MLHSYNDIDEFSSSSSHHVFSHYCENDNESYSSKYLPPLPPSSSSSSLQTNGKEIENNNHNHNHHRNPPSVIIGEPFSALIHSLIPSPQLLLHDTDEQTIYDEYGFRIDINENEQHYEIIPIIENEQAKLKWLTHLDTTYKLDVVHLPLSEEEIIQKIDPKQLRQDTKIPLLLQQSLGIPTSLRAQMWMCLSGSVHKKHQAKMSYTDMLKQCNNDSQLYSKQIEKDLLRTLPTNACFMTMNASGISRLRRILRTVAWLFPDIGYCQGMGVICATLLLLFEEEDAFWMMCSIVEDLLPGQYYSVSLFGVQVDIRVFRYLIQQYLPNIHKVFNEHDIDLTLICFQWFLTLYSNVFHTKFIYHLWDYFFFYGSIILFQIGLMMLKQYEEILMDFDNSAQIFNFLCEVPQLFEYEYGTNERIFHDLPKLFGLSSTIIETHRKKYLAELMSQEGFTINPKMNLVNLPKDILQRRQNQKSTSLNRSSRFSFLNKSNLSANNTQALIERNITQTEMLVNLREAILKIAKHFKDNDSESYSQQNIDLNVDYSIESHVKDHEHYANISLQKCKRAKALLDFECQDSNELGFKKNDILKILSMNDEHCWIGELNGKHGWFPAKFVQLVDERSKLYSLAGDDSINENISDLVRGKLASCIKSIFEHGLRKTPIVLGGVCHPWLFIEEAALHAINKDFDSVYARLILCKTYRLDEDGRILTPEELLCRCIRSINYTHNLAHAQMDVKLRSFISVGLNEQVLHLWLETLCSCTDIINKWYLPWSFLRSPCWVQIKCDLRVLQQFSFTLQQDFELPAAYKQLDVLSSVRDMLMKHHLFSWDL
ncbi:unnamed protein product [Adineta steineri]|uniref:RUN and TBC1 domain-containing protein 3 n=1 Tax=Adineta steineri TaxID=433720 RepID=A0A818HH85_9BILA|nr:unnamed protein product [Adineta steineri]CAF3508290.1 unnamed protein product [Adineta steineri]